MADTNEYASVIPDDPYLVKRKSPSEAEQQLHLMEVDFSCPLCGSALRHRKQKKGVKLYEIAHIFPNSPTKDQYENLGDLPRLGDNSESFDNKIALCKNCHAQQDYHTTQDDYLALYKKKLDLLQQMDLREATLTMGLEPQIADVVNKLCTLKEDELASLNYTPVRLTKKFTSEEFRIKNRVSMYVTNYYPYIRDCFSQLEGINGFRLTALSLQIKSCFTKMEGISSNKAEIFDQLVDWIMAKSLSADRDACEAVISFFVQNCEVFYEITE